MPRTLICDTNYIRGLPLGTNALLKEELPSTLQKQVDVAIRNGDLIVFPRTVVIEIDAHLKQEAERAITAMQRARDLLIGYRFTLTEPKPLPHACMPSFERILKQRIPGVHILEPTHEDYSEAERRTSFRLPPLPKSPDGEEFRDRIIWSQIVRKAQEVPGEYMIASSDTLFHNGGASEEGVRLSIQCTGDADALDQWLGKRPPHIQALIERVGAFAEQMKADGLTFTPTDVERLEELRIIAYANGTYQSKFVIHFSPASGLFPVPVRLISFGDQPLSISIDTENGTKTYSREISQLHPHAALELALGLNRTQDHIGDLRRILQGVQ